MIEYFQNTIGAHDFFNAGLIIFDFDGVFTDNTVSVSDNGSETIRCWRSDGLGISRMKEINIGLFIISTEVNPVVSVRAKKLGLPCRQGVSDKASAVLSICDELKIPIQNTVFLGNDINDIPALKLVGMPVVVRDAYPEVFPYVKYRTQKPGGFGAVRELCDIIYEAKKTLR